MSSESISIRGNNPVASVCIATYRRPEGLRRLLQSLVTQRDAPGFEVVVIDNDATMSARATADEFSTALDIHYAMEPERGVAAVRNSAVRMARGEFVAFVDDDEVVPGTWLAALHRVVAGKEVAAAIGPVTVEFESGVSDPIRRCRFFRRPDFPRGAPISFWHASTSNAYLRVSALPDRATPFRPQFGPTGGEDVDLFKRIAEAGGVIVAAGIGARITEFRDRARANFWWAMRRSLRNGGNMADMLWHEKPPRERKQLARSAFRTAVENVIYAVKVYSRDKLRAVEHCIEAAEHAGRCLSVLGYRYAEYSSRR